MSRKDRFTYKNNIKKEDDYMAITAKPNEATIIKKDMLSPFINALTANKPSKEYWNECSNNHFSSSDIEIMKKMFNGKNN